MTDGSEIRLLLADVDGTLVTKEKVLTDRARQAVLDLKATGVKFALTSGRPPQGMKMLIGPLQIDTPIAGFNGGLFANPDLSTVEEHTLEPDLAKTAVDIILKNGMDCWVYSGEDWFLRDTEAPHAAREQRTVQFPPKVTKDLYKLLDKPVKIVGISDDYDLVAKTEKDVQQAIGEKATAARSQPYYLDVTHKSANKGTVLQFLSKKYSIPPECIATIGDMPNDVLMFKPSGLSIAMGNASDEVKAEADCTTDSFADEGFAKAVEKYLLKKNQG
jgi:Cof subfamily protein (haloacid dehalogenase superfamily)